MANYLRGIILIVCLAGFMPHVTAQVYTDVLASSGISTAALGEYGNGVSFFDWNKDGYDDVVVLHEDSFPRFFQNSHGTLTEVYFIDLQFRAHFRSICWVDINNDGAMDIAFNTRYDGFPVFINNGDFTFTNVSYTCGIEQILADGYAQAWADYDKDGWLDLYVSYYENDESEFATTNKLYRNLGDGTFEEVSVAAQVDNGYKYTLVSVFFDYDKDSWPDLLVLNDRTYFENYLYRNLGNGQFEDVSEQAGINYAIESMTGTVGDMNNDGWLDVFITNSYPNQCLLHVNNGDGTFTESAGINNLLINESCWGGAWIDYDNDMLQDLYVATQPFPGQNHLFHNLGNTFETNFNSGMAGQGSTFSVAMGDLNQDGYPDLLTHSYDTLGTKLWQNTGGNNTFLKVRLEGVISNRDGIGSWVEIYTPDGTKQTRYTLCGEHYLAQNSSWMFFGLGTQNMVDSLRIIWPSGYSDTFYAVEANQHLQIREGSSLVNHIAYAGNSFICQGDSTVLDGGNWDTYQWSTGETSRFITVSDNADYFVATTLGPFQIHSDTLSIDVIQNPTLEINTIQPTCFGASDGSIEILGAPQGSQITWENGDVGALSSQLLAADYTYEIISSEGCLYSGDVLLNEPALVSSYAFRSLDISSLCDSDWDIHFIASGGTGNYVYTWGIYEDLDDSPQQFGMNTEPYVCFNAPTSYTLVYTVFDQKNCMYSDTLPLMDIPLSTENYSFEKLSIYPNPAQNTCMISGLTAPETIRILSMQGVEMDYEIQWSKTVTTLNISRFPAGMYRIIAEIGGNRVAKNFVKL